MRVSAPQTNVLAPARRTAAVPARPQLRAVIRHLALNLLFSALVPAALFYACLLTANLWTALIAALLWCYATVGYRLATGQPMSMLLWLTTAGLTGKTVVAFATGAALPRVRKLFARLTLLWAGICAAKAAVTVWLLFSMSLPGFVTAKTVFMPSAAVAGAALTVWLSVRVARHEGLLAAPRRTTAPA